jgi:hypothetical protein
MPRVNKLEDLDLAEISLVPDGANQGAKVVLFKMKKQGGFETCSDCENPEGCMQKGKCAAAGGPMAKLKALLEKTFGFAADDPAALAKFAEQAGIDLIPEGNDMSKPDAMTPEQVTKMISDQVAAAVAKANADNAAALAAAVEKARTEGKAEAEALVAKANEEAAKTKAALEKIVADNAHSDRVAKVKGFQLAGVDADAIAKVYGQLNEDGAKALDAAFEALSKQAQGLQKRLTEELGSSATNTTDRPALAKINAKAQELRKAKPELTHDQAVAAVVSEDPSLYAEYRAEQRGASATRH